MNYPKYDIQAVSDNTGFSFVSIGLKSEVKLYVLFQLIDKELSKYNLVLGPLNSENEIDDLFVVANGDRYKILATVATYIFIFFKDYPAAIIYFSGSTSARTRLYQRAIRLNILQLQKEFTILGEQEETESELYVPGKNYIGFFIARKFIFD